MSPTYTPRLDRRNLLLGSAFLLGLPVTACAQPAQASPRLAVFKTPTCACCDGWVSHMRAAGFTVDVTVQSDLKPVRDRSGVPDTLASCHSGLIEGYHIEGHVPAGDVRRLLTERPAAIGLTVPGMPMGSPGMETAGAADSYSTLLILKSGTTRVFARHNAAA